MSDLIDRQAAIDAPVKMVSEGLDWIPVYHIKGLPSAQPEDKCGECDAWNQYKNYTRPDIVYCKYCICGHGEVWLSGNGAADFYGYCGRSQLPVLPYDHCSYGKRRTNETD